MINVIAASPLSFLLLKDVSFSQFFSALDYILFSNIKCACKMCQLIHYLRWKEDQLIKKRQLICTCECKFHECRKWYFSPAFARMLKNSQVACCSAVIGKCIPETILDVYLKIKRPSHWTYTLEFFFQQVGINSKYFNRLRRCRKNVLSFSDKVGESGFILLLALVHAGLINNLTIYYKIANCVNILLFWYGIHIINVKILNSICLQL